MVPPDSTGFLSLCYLFTYPVSLETLSPFSSFLPFYNLTYCYSCIVPLSVLNKWQSLLPPSMPFLGAFFSLSLLYLPPILRGHTTYILVKYGIECYSKKYHQVQIVKFCVVFRNNIYIIYNPCQDSHHLLSFLLIVRSRIVSCRFDHVV